MTEKSARPSDPQNLARALVDQRLADLCQGAGLVMFPEKNGEDDPLWEQMVDAVRSGCEEDVAPARIKAVQAAVDGPAEDSLETTRTLYAMLDCHAAADFLVGVELGRRLGGVR